MSVLARQIIVFLAVALVALPTDIIAQTHSEEKLLPFRPAGKLSEQEKRGQHWFLQRCALCHLPKYTKSKEIADPPPIWKNLEGLFRGASEDKEKVVRAFILNGTQRMPGFQYTLQPNEIDDLIAYLKTL